jgi:hypothetical protein
MPDPAGGNLSAMPAAATRPRKDYAPRSRPARYPPGGAWPAEMRADMAAAFLDFETSGQLFHAILRGEAPRPTSTRLRAKRQEPVWALDVLREHIAKRHEISSDVESERDDIASQI